MTFGPFQDRGTRPTTLRGPPTERAWQTTMQVRPRLPNDRKAVARTAYRRRCCGQMEKAFEKESRMCQILPDYNKEVTRKARRWGEAEKRHCRPRRSRAAAFSRGEVDTPPRGDGAARSSGIEKVVGAAVGHKGVSRVRADGGRIYHNPGAGECNICGTNSRSPFGRRGRRSPRRVAPRPVSTWRPVDLATWTKSTGRQVGKSKEASNLRQDVRNVGLVQGREGEASLAEVVQRSPDVDQDGSVEDQEPVVEPVRGLHGERIAELRVEGMATPCSVNAYGVCSEKRSRSGLSQFVITSRERCRLAGDIFVAGCRTPPRWQPAIQIRAFRPGISAESIFVKPKHFLPRSLRDAPIR